MVTGAERVPVHKHTGKGSWDDKCCDGVVRAKWGWAWSAGAVEDLREADAHWWGISE